MVITQCPECHAIFRASEGQLRIAQGRVRCGQCLSIFDARLNALERATAPLHEQPLQSVDREATSTTDTSPEPVQPPRQESPVPTRPTAATPPAQHPPPAASELHFSPEPLTLHVADSSTPSPVSVLLGLLLSALLVCTLIAQYLWFERGRLASRPALQPYYLLACEHLPCQLPANQSLSALSTEQAVMRPHQQFNDLIAMAIKIRNDSPFAMPYPAIEISFTNLQGRLVARRTFEPNDYLSGEQLNQQLQPDLNLEISLPLTLPSPEAVSYQVELRQPLP